MDLEKYISENWILKIKVIPNSPKTDFAWEMEDWTLKLKSKWVPEKWKVNTEIIKFIAKTLKISKENIKIISGETSRQKLLKIEKEWNFSLQKPLK